MKNKKNLSKMWFYREKKQLLKREIDLRIWIFKNIKYYEKKLSIELKS